MKPINEVVKEKESLFSDNDVLRGLREGIEIEKGVVLTEDYLVEHFDEISKLMTEFSAYPDIYLDVITPSDSNFSLFFY